MTAGRARQSKTYATKLSDSSQSIADAIAEVQADADAAAASATAAATSATNSATSATSAATSATAAAGSATTAATQATNASNSATTAGTQATNSATSATNAATSATAAASSATASAASAAASEGFAITAAGAASVINIRYPMFDHRYNYIETDVDGWLISGVDELGGPVTVLDPNIRDTPLPLFDARDSAFSDVLPDGTVVEELTELLQRRSPSGWAGTFTPDNPSLVPYIDNSTGNLKAVGDSGDVTLIKTADTNYTDTAAYTFRNAVLDHGVPVAVVERGSSRWRVAATAANSLTFLADPNVIYCILGNGQSLSCGTQSYVPYATTLADYDNILMPYRAAWSDVRCGQFTDAPTSGALIADIDVSTITGFTKAFPRGNPTNSLTFGETPLERAAKLFTDRCATATGKRPNVLILSQGVGSSTADMLKKTSTDIRGTMTTNIYNSQMSVLTRMNTLAAAAGKRLVILMVLRKQGEQGSDDANYVSTVTQTITDFNTDVMAITGQKETPIWVEHQTSSVAYLDPLTPPGTIYQQSQRGLRTMHNSGVLHLAGVDYGLMGRSAFATTDWVHLTALGSAVVGEEMVETGLAALAKRRPIMTQPDPAGSITNVSGNTWRWPWVSESGTIQFDTGAGFTDPGNYGVTYTDATGGITVSSVALSPGNTGLDVTFSGNISARTSRVLRYGENGPASGAGFSATTKPRGNVRCTGSYGTSSVDGVTRRRWGLHSHQAF